MTYSGWFTHISGHPSAASQAQDRESSPAKDRRSTTVPRSQQGMLCRSRRIVFRYAVLSRYFCPVYIDDLIRKLQRLNYGCFVRSACVNAFLYADDIILLAPSIDHHHHRRLVEDRRAAP